MLGIEPVTVNQPHEFDLILNRTEALAFVKEHGFDEFFAYCDRTFKEKRLYSVSTDWMSHRRCVCKLKGEHGDVLIGFYGEHVI